MNKAIGFWPTGQVIKLSSSNIEASVIFYTMTLGLIVDGRYTLHSPPHEFGDNSFVQLNFPWPGNNVALGLFKDIPKPFPQIDFNNPNPGTVPTFVVDNIEATRDYLLSNNVPVSEIISNTSDRAHTDHFAFFGDPDNNLLCMRQDMN